MYISVIKIFCKDYFYIVVIVVIEIYKEIGDNAEFVRQME